MTTLEVRRVRLSDPDAAPLVAELTYEYTTRYGPTGAQEMQRSADVFEPPQKEAQTFGYRRIHLTTGPRQPEAKALYLATGYTPLFDVDADPVTIGPLAFGKEIH